MRGLNLGVASWWTVAYASQWSYKWPYGANDACQCQENGFGFKHFNSKDLCLESFAEEQFETCSYKKNGEEQGGLREEQCGWVVSRTPTMDNGDCEELCQGVILGMETLNNLLSKCSFEFVAIYDSIKRVALKEESCFSNYVYGFSDYKSSTTALKILHDVPSPARCQALCQRLPNCAYFQWKAFEDTDGIDGYEGFENAPHTCVLQTEDFINNVLSIDTMSLSASPKYCDLKTADRCKDTFNTFDLIHEKPCLICDCVPKCAFYSDIHVSGPAFCSNSRDLCHYMREDLTTTEEPGCPTLECPAPQKAGFFGHLKAAFVGDEEVGEQTLEGEEATVFQSDSTATPIVLETLPKFPHTATTVVLESTTNVLLDTTPKV